jgi:agmatinase
MSKEETIKNFDPNGPGIKGNLFGLPYSIEESELVIVPVPWEVTVSYRTGTASGPKAILDASSQIDFFVREISDAWKLGVSMLPYPEKLYQENLQIRSIAKEYITAFEKGESTENQKPIVARINEACESLNIYVKNTTQKLLKEGKLVGLLGGDHSTPLGFIRALSEQYNRFGILHIDAHCDLRKAYEGFIYSHGSIMYNALKIPAVNRIVQVGIRDLCEEEMNVVDRAMGRVKVFFDEDMKADQYNGKKNWESICNDIIKELPPLVYISLDIDGLDPKFCPNTGTPVPGGLEFNQVIYLLKTLVKSGKKIIGFDLNEVAPGRNDDWDGNVGARLLYQLGNWMAVSQNKLSLRS